MSSGQQRILCLLRILIKRTLTALVKLQSADEGFHSTDALDAVLREVAMDVDGICLAAVTDMLKSVYLPAAPSASGLGKAGSATKKAKDPAPAALRPWMGKTVKNPHCILSKVIQRTWA